MKRTLLFSFVTLIIMYGCVKHQFTCNINSPYDGAKILINKELLISIEATDSKNTIEKIQLFVDTVLYCEFKQEPYTVNIPSNTLKEGGHKLKAIAINSEKEQAESKVVKFNAVKSLTEPESPDFVSFKEGIPEGWKTYTWELDTEVGYDDNYSLRSANYPVALVFAYKKVDTTGFVEFYTKGGEVVLYVDGEKATAISSTAAENNWTKWLYTFEKGRHEFKWEAEGIKKYIDVVKFYEIK